MGIILLGLGLGFNSRFTVSEHNLHAVVHGDLPLDLTQSNVEYVLNQANVKLNDDSTLLITDSKLSSVETKQLTKETEADLILAIKPDSGMIYVPENSIYSFADKSDEKTQISSSDYGIKSNLSGINTDDLKEVVLNNFQSVHGH